VKLTLGTAQLGLPQYGRTNATGCPSEADAIALIHAAIDGGVPYIDCACAYGLAEERVGKAVFGDRSSVVGGQGTGVREQEGVATGFMPGSVGSGEISDNRGVNPLATHRENVATGFTPGQLVTVITKLSPLAWLAEDAPEETVRAAVEASVYQSCHNLCLRTLPVLMLHRWAHHDSHDGQIWEILLELKKKGVIGALGASVYTPEEAIEAMTDPAVAHLQIPFNLLDHRWLAPDFQTAKSKRPDLTIHVRSAYLQGILLAGPEAWPKKDGFDATAICERLDTLVRELGRQSRADLCLAYLNSCPFVDSILVGVETIEQLIQNLELFQQASLSAAEREGVESSMTDIPAWLLNPAEW